MAQPLELHLATPENRLMDRLVSDWERQLRLRRAPVEVLDQIRGYDAKVTPDRRYGVRVLCSAATAAPGGKGPFEAFVHVNHAHPGSSKPTLRLVWNRIAPRYEASPDPILDHSRVFSGIIGGALRLAHGEMTSREIKVFLCNPADHRHAKALSHQLTAMGNLPFKVSVRGSWLHFELTRGGQA